MRLNRGTLVTASIGSPSGKPRPLLVLRSDHFAAHSLVTIVSFTGSLTNAPSLRVTVQPSAENGLHATSQAMIDHIQSVRTERVEREIGRLADADLLAVTRAVAVYLGFADPGPRQRRRTLL